MAVTGGEVRGRPLAGDLGQALGVRNAAQDGVDKAGGAGIAARSAQFHRFAHRRAGGNAVEKQELIDAEAQDVPHRRLELFMAEAVDVKIAEPVVLQHPEAEAGGQGRVAPVKLCAL